MIISASRRTDIPAAHADWFFNRLKEGFVLARNPMNPRQVRRISLRREDVDGIVFWTKNPQPMMDRLDALDGYVYYFQYTLTGYGPDAEAHLPSVEARLDSFKRLSEKLGPERVLWRYDPVVLSSRYPESWHEENFSLLARSLRDCTPQVTISFVDVYARNKRRLEALGAREIPSEQMRRMAARIAQIAAENGMETVACCEKIDLESCGVRPAWCVDAQRLGRIGGVPLQQTRDPNQRSGCGCAPSVDIGAYNTCPNGCAYCYANYSPALLKANMMQRDDASPMLCDHPSPEDKITQPKVQSLRDGQIRMQLE